MVRKMNTMKTGNFRAFIFQKGGRKMNKHGWLRILEAFIAILLVTGFLLFVSVRRSGQADIGEDIQTLEQVILNQIAGNDALRQAALDDNIGTLETFVEPKIPQGMNFTIRICALNDVCGLTHYEKEVYSSNVVISATLSEYNPKKVALFMWALD